MITSRTSTIVAIFRINVKMLSISKILVIGSSPELPTLLLRVFLIRRWQQSKLSWRATGRITKHKKVHIKSDIYRLPIHRLARLIKNSVSRSSGELKMMRELCKSWESSKILKYHSLIPQKFCVTDFVLLLPYFKNLPSLSLCSCFKILQC